MLSYALSLPTVALGLIGAVRWEIGYHLSCGQLWITKLRFRLLGRLYTLKLISEERVMSDTKALIEFRGSYVLPIERAVEVPTALVAVTENVYDVPLVRPVMMQVRDVVVVQPADAGTLVTV